MVFQVKQGEKEGPRLHSHNDVTVIYKVPQSPPALQTRRRPSLALAEKLPETQQVSHQQTRAGVSLPEVRMLKDVPIQCQPETLAGFGSVLSNYAGH